MTEPQPISESFSWTSFSPNRATKQPNGTIVVPAGGYSEDQGIWDGLISITPDHPDYQFWLWLLKRWDHHSTLSAEDIPTLKGEFAQEPS
jgi:hypothetical protein